MAHLRGGLGRDALPAARSDQCLELQRFGNRLANQDRQFWQPPGVQARKHAPNGERRVVCRGGAAPRQLSGRGLAYWSDGRDERILYVTPGYQLICLDAKTGLRVASFGNKGAIDLKQDDDQEILPDLTTGEIGIQSAPVVAKNTIIIGAAFREGMTPKSMRNNKGYVRGFDVRTGKRLWIFHTIPKKGEFGYDTWEKGSAEYTGNTGVWTQITVDE